MSKNFYCHTKTFEDAASQPGFANVCVIHGYRFKFYEGDPLRGIHVLGCENQKLILDDRLPKGYLFRADDPLVIGLTGTEDEQRAALRKISAGMPAALDQAATDGRKMVKAVTFLGYISKIWPTMEVNGLTIQDALSGIQQVIGISDEQLEALLTSHAIENGPVPAVKQ